jgi:hypothetical protein
MKSRTARRTFRDALELVAERNADRLMHRARLANRLAKTAEGRGRRAAYRVKTAALVTLRERFPHRVEIAVDPTMPKFVVVRVETARFGLHAPAVRFTL